MPMKTLIDDKRIFNHLFQPIYDLSDWKVIGYEALIRSQLHNTPEALFNHAEKEKSLYEIDSQSMHKAYYTYNISNQRKKNTNLFLNIFPSTILHENFPDFLKNSITFSENIFEKIVFEVSELEKIHDWELFKERINWLKQNGFLIAIDDVGSGYYTSQGIINLDINFLKLDRFFAKDLHLSKKKQDFIQFYLNYCNQYGIKLILEGVENEQELAIAKYLKVPYAQGYLLGKPDVLK